NHLDDTRGYRTGRHRRDRGRFDLPVLRSDWQWQPDPRDQRSHERSDLQGPRADHEQTVLEPLADARRIYVRPYELERLLHREHNDAEPELRTEHERTGRYECLFAGRRSVRTDR